MSHSNPEAPMPPSSPASGAPADQAAEPNAEVMQFPMPFPIKVMGLNENGFVHAITQIAERFDPAFNAATVELRESSGGKYLGVTITVTATSREQLDNIYRALTSHPQVKWAL